MTKENMTDQIEEAKATGEDSENMDPVTGAGGPVKKRRADLNKVVDPEADDVEKHVKAPKGTNDHGLKEAFGKLFEGEELSESFKTNVSTIFEAEIHQRTEEIREALEGEYETKLEEEIKSFSDELMEKMDAYLDHVAETWMEKNAQVVESNIKIEVAESLLEGVRSLAVEHNLNIDTSEEIDAVAELERRLDEARAELNETIKENMEYKSHVESLEKSVIFNELTENLSETQTDRVRKLSESISYKDVADYSEKVSVIIENYITESKSEPVSKDVILEEIEEEKPAHNSKYESVARYARAFDEMSKT